MLDIVMGKNSQLPNLMVKEVGQRESKCGAQKYWKLQAQAF